MKNHPRILLVALTVLAIPPAFIHAQQISSNGSGNGSQSSTSGAPSNPCPHAPGVNIDSTNGDLYTCPVAGGSWVKWPTAGATSSQGSVGAFQIAAAAGAFAGTTHFSYTNPTIAADATGVLDLHLAGASGLFLPGTLSSGFVRVVTSTGAITGGELSGDCVTSGSRVVTCTPLLHTANNLSELTATASTARTNIGLGTVATHAATEYALAFTGTCSPTHLVAGDSSCLPTANSSVWITDGSGNPLLSTTLPASLTIPGYQLTSGKDAPSGYAGLSAGSLINTAECPTATGSTKGCLTGADWTTFNGKQAALGYTPLNPVNNLADVASVSGSRVSLGLGAFNGLRRANGGSSDTPAVAGTDYQAPLGYTAENIANKDGVSGYAGLTAGGLLKTAELPLPGASALGGVFSKDCSTTPGQMLQKINTDGSATCTTPFYSLVGVDGTSRTARHRVNLVTGTNITITPVDNAGTDSTDITIDSTGGGGPVIAYATVSGTVSGAVTQRSLLNFSAEFTVADNSGATRTDISVASIANTKITGLGTASTHATTDYAAAFTGTCTSSSLVRADGACVTTLPSGLSIPGFQASLGYTPLNPANNLSEVTPGTARTNLGLAIGTNVEAWAANLDTYAGKTPPSGAVVGSTDIQTLTNKTVDGVSPTTFGFLDATSSIQTQLNGKQASLGFTAENAANKDAVSGYAGLTAGSLLKLAEFPATLTGINSATASALAANGTNCSAGSPPLGIDASGNAEACTALTAAQVTNAFDKSANNVLGTHSLDFTDISTPGSPPAAGHTFTYTKGGKFCSLDPSSNEFCTGGNLTTKGDLLSFSTVPVRVGVGTDTYVVTADSTQSVGWKWAPSGTAVAFQNSGSAILSSTTLNFVPGSGIIGGFTNVSGVATFNLAFSTGLLATHDQIHANENYVLSSNGTTAYTALMAIKALTTYTRGMSVLLETDVDCATSCTLGLDGNLPAPSIKLSDGTTNPGGTLQAHRPQWVTLGPSTCTVGTNCVWLLPPAGSSMVYPGAGIAVSTGSAWATSLTAPSGAIVGTTDIQTLTNKILTSPSLGTGSSPLTTRWTVGTGGVTANTLVQADASNPAKIVAATTGTIGIAMSTVSAAGTVDIATIGIVNCVTDTSGATAGDLVVIGTGTVIDCKDSGQTSSASVPTTTRIIGVFRSSASAGSQALVQLSPSHFGNQLQLANGVIYVGNSSGVAVGVSMSGDAAISNTGAVLNKQSHYTVRNIQFSDSPYTIVDSDSFIVCNATSGLVILNLPTASGGGREIIFSKKDSSGNVCRVTRTGSDLIDGFTAQDIQNQTEVYRTVDTATLTWSNAINLLMGGDVTGSVYNNKVTLIQGAVIPTSANLVGTNGGRQFLTATSHNISLPGTCVAASASGTAYTCTTSPTFTPAAGDHIWFKADVANTASATIAANGATAATIKKQGGATNLILNDLLAGQYVAMLFDGTNWQMQGQLGNAAGSSAFSALTGSTNTTAAMLCGTGCSLGPTGSGTVNANQYKGAAIPRGFSATFYAGGATLSSGLTFYQTVPYACTVSAWNITADSGTVTFDIWKIATGTALPTIANTITASAQPALASGTALHSTTLTSWTTSVAANDIVGVNLKTVSGATNVGLTVQCDQ